MNLSFAAIDFETATGYMESACAVGIVTVTDGEITDEYYSLIQPPENEYWRANMLVHGITPGMTESLPGFHAIYPEVKKRLQGNVVVAHNEQFDRNVLKNTMRMYGLDYDERYRNLPFVGILKPHLSFFRIQAGQPKRLLRTGRHRT